MNQSLRPPMPPPEPEPGPGARPLEPAAGIVPGTMLTVPLYRAAHGRTGDKGDRSNISVIAWQPALWGLLVQQVTEARVAERFAARRPATVKRHLLPKLHAMNFVLDGVLDGGVNSALNLDSHGKCLSYLLLDLPIEVPAELVPLLAGPPDLPPPTA